MDCPKFAATRMCGSPEGYGATSPTAALIAGASTVPFDTRILGALFDLSRGTGRPMISRSLALELAAAAGHKRVSVTQIVGAR